MGWRRERNDAVTLTLGSDLHGDPAVLGPDPVKFQGGGTGLIEKPLLRFLLRLLRCFHLRKSQLPSLLGYFDSACLHAGIQFQPGRNGTPGRRLVAWRSDWVAQQ